MISAHIWNLPAADELYGSYPEIPTEVLMTEDMDDPEMDRVRADYVRLDFIYFITAAPVADVIKIGFTAGYPKQRLLGLQASSPVPLYPLGVIRGDRSYERWLHGVFSPFRLHGEWFRAEQPLLDFVSRYALPWADGNPGFTWIANDAAWNRAGDFADLTEVWRIKRIVPHCNPEAASVDPPPRLVNPVIEN